MKLRSNACMKDNLIEVMVGANKIKGILCDQRQTYSLQRNYGDLVLIVNVMISSIAGTCGTSVRLSKSESLSSLRQTANANA